MPLNSMHINTKAANISIKVKESNKTKDMIINRIERINHHTDSFPSLVRDSIAVQLNYKR